MKAIARTLVVVASIILLHAAYSTYEHLSTLKALGRPLTPASSLPTSIIVEALAALLLFVPSVALATAPLQDVTYRGELAKQSVDDADARMGFARLSARGRALFGDDYRGPI